MQKRKTPMPTARKGRALLWGFGLDPDGGHYRFTMNDQCRFLGGTLETHRAMQTRAEEIVREFSRRGYSLDNLTRDQAEEMARLLEEMQPQPEAKT